MSITSVTVTNKTELTNWLVAGFTGAQACTLIDVKEQVIAFYKRWMKEWDRKFAIIGSIKDKGLLEVEVSNTVFTGKSETDLRPRARPNVPSYVNFGTDGRKVALTEVFSPKTIPGQIDSVPGVGGFSHVIDESEGPIKGRFVDKAIDKQLEDGIVVRAFENCFDKYFR